MCYPAVAPNCAIQRRPVARGEGGGLFDFRGTSSGRHGFGQTVRSQDGSCLSILSITCGQARTTRFSQKDRLADVLWTDGAHHFLCDYRIYEKLNDGKTKNDH